MITAKPLKLIVGMVFLLLVLLPILSSGLTYSSTDYLFFSVEDDQLYSLEGDLSSLPQPAHVYLLTMTKESSFPVDFTIEATPLSYTSVSTSEELESLFLFDIQVKNTNEVSKGSSLFILPKTTDAATLLYLKRISVKEMLRKISSLHERVEKPNLHLKRTTPSASKGVYAELTDDKDHKPVVTFSEIKQLPITLEEPIVWEQEVVLANNGPATEYVLNLWEHPSLYTFSTSSPSSFSSFLDSATSISILEGEQTLSEGGISVLSFNGFETKTLTIRYVTAPVVAGKSCYQASFRSEVPEKAILIQWDESMASLGLKRCSYTLATSFNGIYDSLSLPVDSFTLDGQQPLVSQLSKHVAIEGRSLLVNSLDQATNFSLIYNLPGTTLFPVVQGPIEFTQPVFWNFSYRYNDVLYHSTYITPPVYLEKTVLSNSTHWAVHLELTSRYKGIYQQLPISVIPTSWNDLTLTPYHQYLVLNDSLFFYVNNFNQFYNLTLSSKLLYEGEEENFFEGDRGTPDPSSLLLGNESLPDLLLSGENSTQSVNTTGDGNTSNTTSLEQNTVPSEKTFIEQLAEEVLIDDPMEVDNTTIQMAAEVGKPVTWVKKVNPFEQIPGEVNETHIKVQLPPQATNVTLYQVDKKKNVKEKISERKISKRQIKGKTLEQVQGKLFFGTTSGARSTTGDSLEEDDLVEATEVVVEIDGINDGVIGGGSSRSTSADEEFEIIYETEAPQISEEIVSDSLKRVTISSEFHYQNVSSYATIPETKSEAITLYWIQNGSRTLFEEVTHIDTNNDGLIDRLEWITPHLSNQTFEISLTILTVQSYPRVGGLWVAEFNTTGTANLTIKASNGTTWSEEVVSGKDLQFIELRCGNDLVSYEWTGDAVFVENYFCNETSYETSKVLTTGKHFIEFTFGDNVAYAKNDAGIEPDVILLRGAGGNPDDTSDAPVNWTTQDRIDTGSFNHSTTVDPNLVQVLEDGVYRVSYGLYTVTSGGNRYQLLSHVEVDGVNSNACYGSGYNRGITGSFDMVSASECLLNLSAGQNISVVARRVSNVASMAPVYTGSQSWLHVQRVNQTQVLILQDTTGNDAYDVQPTNITFDTIVRNDSIYNYTSGSEDVQVLQDGLYRLTYSIGLDHTSNNRLSTIGNLIITPDGGSPQNSSYGWSHINQRGNGNSREAALSTSTILNLSQNDIIHLQVSRDSITDPGAPTTVGGQIHLDIEYLGDTTTGNVLMIYDSAGGDDLDPGPINQTWDTKDYEGRDFNYTVDSENITVKQTGLYHISYGTYINRSDFTDVRFEWVSSLLVNGDTQNVCLASGYVRGIAGTNIYESHTGGAESSCYIELQAGDNITLHHEKTSDGSDVALTSVANRIWFTMQNMFVETSGPDVLNMTVIPSPRTIGQEMNFTANVTDRTGVTTVIAILDLANGTQLNLTMTDQDSDGIYNATFNQTQESGSSNFTIYSTDLLGNINDTEKIEFNITLETLSATTDSDSYVVNQTAYIHGTGFYSDENVTITILDPTLDPLPGYPKNLTSNHTGRVNDSWMIPDGQQLGEYIVNFTSTTNTSRYVSSTFDVVTAVVQALQSSYEQGDVINITGFSWDNDVNVTLNITDPTGFLVLDPVNRSSNASGDINASWISSYNSTLGNYTINAIQPSNPSKIDTFIFELTARPVDILTNFTWYKENEIVEMYGHGFSPNQNVTVDIFNTTDDRPTGFPQNVTSNNTGGINLTWTVPPGQTLGVYTINATDYNYTNLQNSTLITIVTQSITTDSVAYSSGDVVLITGQYWERGSNVTIDIQNSTPASATGYPVNVTANSNGAISTFWVSQPGGGFGAEVYNLTAWQDLDNSINDSTTFNVTKVATVDSNKYDYTHNETANFSGSFYSPSGQVQLNIKNVDLDQDAEGYPKLITADVTGDISHLWNSSDFCAGTYRVETVDQSFPSLLFANDSFVIDASDFKVQHGYSTIAIGDTEVTITAGTDYDPPAQLNKSFIRIIGTRLSGVGNENNGDNQFPSTFMASISNPQDLLDNITFARYSASADNTTRIYWEVIEYRGAEGGPNEIIVRDQAEITNSATLSVNGSSVSVDDDNDVVVWITGQRVNAAATSGTDQGLYTSEWLSATDIPEFTKGDAAGTSAISYSVVEYVGSAWSVQRSPDHTYVAAATDEFESITAFTALNQTFIHAQMRTASGALDEQGQRIHLSANDTLTFRLRSGAGIAGQVGAAWVIGNNHTNGTPMIVNRYSASRPNSGPEPEEWTESITAITNVNRTSIMGETADSSGTGNAAPRGSIGFEITSTTQATLWRSDTGQNQDYRFEVVEWPSVPYSCTNFDTLNPNVTQMSPSDISYNLTDTVNITAHVVDDTTLSTILVTITYPNGSLVNLSLVDSDADDIFNGTFTDTTLIGRHNVTYFANDTWKNENVTETGFFFVNDTLSPLWSANTTYPNSSVVYAPGQSYQFNITWTDDFLLETLVIEHNFTGTLDNYSFTGNNSTEYYYDYSDLSAGSYVWRSYANDTTGNVNVSDQWEYIVQKNTSVLNVTLNGAEDNLTVEVYSTVNISSRLITPSAGYVEIYQEHSLINNGSAPLENLSDFNATGYFNITVFYNETINYSGSFVTYFVNVTDTGGPNITFVNATPQNQTLGGSINISAFINDTVAINASLVLIDYPNGTQVNFTLTDNDLDAIYNVTFNDTSIIGLYNITIYANDSSNNINDSEKFNFSVSYESLTLTTNKDDYIVTEVVNITGTGYSAFSNVTIYLTNSSGDPVTGYPKNVTANYTGGINDSWSIPGGQTLDTYTVNATDVLNDTRSEETTFNIVTAIVEANKLIYEQGEIVNITGSNWDPTENVTLNISNTSSVIFDGPLNRTSSAIGDINHSWSIPYNATPGIYTIGAFQPSNLAKNDTFVINVTARPVTLAVNYPWYKVQEIVNITGEGFSPDANVTIDIFNSSGDRPTGFPQNVTSNGTGAINLTWIIPVSQDLDAYTVNATDYLYPNLYNTTSFDIVIQNITVDQSAYSSGETVLVSGIYWDRDSNVTISIRNSSDHITSGYPKNVTADSNGTVSDTWVSLPGAGFGAETYNLTAWQDLNIDVNDSVSFDVTKVATLTVNQTEFEQNETINITGSFYSVNGNITINITSLANGGNAQGYPRTIVADGMGDIYHDWNVSTFCNGTYLVETVDQSFPAQLFANTTFNITFLRANGSIETADDVNFTGNYTTVGGSVSDTTTSNNAWQAFGGTDLNGNLETWANYTFDISSLNIQEKRISSLNFSLEYCHTGDQVGLGCGIAKPHEGTSQGEQQVELYNFTGGTWVTIGNLTVNDTDDGEMIEYWNMSSGISDFIQDNLISIRFEVNFTQSGTDDVFLAIDHATLNLTFESERERDCIDFDIIPPNITNVTNITINFTNALGAQFNATDDRAIGNWSVNDSLFTINSSGFLQNVSTLALGIYWLNITAFDEYNNSNSQVIFVSVEEIIIFTLNISLNISSSAITNITLENITGVVYQQIGNFSQEIDKNNLYNLSLTTNLSVGEQKTTFYNVNISSSIDIPVDIIEFYNSSLPSFITNITTVFAVNDSELDFALANVLLPKNGTIIDDILHCVDWSYVNSNCTTWEINSTSDYNVFENATHISFNVTSFDAFGGGTGDTLVNLTNISVYDITGLSRDDTSNLVYKGLNTTFNLSVNRSYRVLFDVENVGTSWNIAAADYVYHDGLNETWDINTENHIWYVAGDGTEYTGGNFSNGQINWNVSQGGRIKNSEKGNFSYVINITTIATEKYGVYFILNDTSKNSGSTDNSIYSIQGLPDLTVLNITFSTQNAVEGENITVFVNISNNFIENVTNFTVELNISSFNGTFNFDENLVSSNQSLSINESKLVEFNWTVKVGTYEFLAYVDNGFNVTEFNESNNTMSVNYTTSAWQIFYGEYDYYYLLTDGGDANNFSVWNATIPEGNSFYSDADASYVPTNLRALDGANDLSEADAALNMTGFNDSIKALYDINDDNTPDITGTITISGTDISNVPLVNTTNSSIFVTGLLWDSADGGAEFDGTQDLVFVTMINYSQTGFYGEYDYEVRIPSRLEQQFASTDLVNRVDELI